MQPAVLIRLRPSGPWRYGAGEGGAGGGGQDGVDLLFRSDRLFSALTLAAQQLGWLDEWLDATARNNSPALACSSLFPFQGDTLFAPPPSSLWPPPASLVTSPSPVFLNKVRWNAARLVPVSLIESILMGQKVLADQWVPDPESGCLLRRDRPSSTPFRTVIKSGAAVDRLTNGSVRVHKSTCVEFETGAGLWTAVRFASEDAAANWSDRIKAAMRLLADTGFGGRRTVGWGQAQAPEFEPGEWPNLILPKLARALRRSGPAAEGEGEFSSFWLLSLFSPAGADAVDWAGGDYTLVERGGYVESGGVSTGVEKKRVRMVAEGSVLSAKSAVSGTAVDVAPEAFAHPVYRSGIALALKLPIWPEAAAPSAVETPTDPDALDPRPCDEKQTGDQASAAEMAQTETEPQEKPAELTNEPEAPISFEPPEQPLEASPDEEQLASDSDEPSHLTEQPSETVESQPEESAPEKSGHEEDGHDL